MSAPSVLSMLIEVSTSLGELRERVVVVGGAAAGLLVTDPAAPTARPTTDIDLATDIVSYAEDVAFHQRLRELGFVEDTTEGAPRCRWLVNGVTVDVMSPAQGPPEQWYRHATEGASTVVLAPGVAVRVASPAVFLAMKIEAFGDRGKGDATASRDIEDVIAVIDGRPTVVDDVRAAPAGVRDYLADRLRTFLTDPDFVDVVAGHLPGDAASQARAPIVISRIRALALRGQ